MALFRNFGSLLGSSCSCILPDVATKAAPTEDKKLEDVVKEAGPAAVLELVY